MKLMNFFEEIRFVLRRQFMFETMFKTMFKNMVKTMFKTLFKTMLEKSKNIGNKNMEFLKITDTKKRDFIVNEFLHTRQNIQQIFLSEHASDSSTQYELSMLLKSVTYIKQDLEDGLVLKPIREGLKNVPKAITLPQFSSITAYDDGEEEVHVFIRDIAEQYL